MSGTDDAPGLIDEFADGALPAIAPKTWERHARELRPWHKPRKQLVRHGWRDNVSRLMKELHHATGTPKVLRYFTLPAPEMLDIRVLEDAAKNRQYQVQFVGMTAERSGSEDDQHLGVAQATLKAQSDWVHAASDTLHYRLEDLAAGSSPVARRKLREYAPFHVINFDLCGYLLAPDNGAGATVLDALEAIIEMQTSQPGGDWLLFVATRFDEENTCPQKFERVRQAIEDNCASSPEFKNELEQLLQVAAGVGVEFLKDPTGLARPQLRDAICVGLTKWLASKLLQASPPFELDMMTTYVYAVDGGEHDMLSLVYRCRYRGTPAPMTDVAPDSAATVEQRIALRALKKTRELLDIDSHLLSDPAKMNSMAAETKGLLRQANYPDALLDGYDEWASKEAAKAQPSTP